MERDLDKAVSQVVDCLRRQLGEMAPDPPPELGTEEEIALLTEANLLNAARHIVMCLDEYGRVDRAERGAERCRRHR